MGFGAGTGPGFGLLQGEGSQDGGFGLGVLLADEQSGEGHLLVGVPLTGGGDHARDLFGAALGDEGDEGARAHGVAGPVECANPPDGIAGFKPGAGAGMPQGGRLRDAGARSGTEPLSGCHAFLVWPV